MGAWGPVQPLPWRPVHSVLLPTGRILIYANEDQYHWDTTTEQLIDTNDFGYNAFCGGHTLLADGRVFFTGGHIPGCNGLPNASYYDPFTDTYTWVDNMAGGRWYPSLVTLANGDVVTMSGRLEDGSKNLIPEVFEVSTSSWRALTTASLNLPLFPSAFLAPNGQVFLAISTSRYLDTSGTGTWTTGPARIHSGRDNYGSACMYDVGKVLFTGGADSPTATCEIIDLNDPNPTWTASASMPQVRRQHDVTILPDGRVLVIGGSSSAGFNTEDGPKPAVVWDPNTDTWTTWAMEAEYRGYHSEVVLLPDARVASIGGDGHPSLQVFSPPYLFQGARPTITSSPSTVALGDTFFVETPDGANIGQVNLLRPTAATHTQNMNQRINKLPFTVTAGGINATIPISPSECPPGDYMLFLIDSNGVPSVSAWIVVSISAANDAPPAPDGLAAVGGDPLVQLSWNAAPDASAYNVKRSTSAGGPYSEIASDVLSTSFTDTGLANSTTYYYVVSAVNSAGESPDSAEVSATPMLQPPGAPTELEAVGNDSRVDLVWSAPSGTVDTYTLKRSLSSGGPYANVSSGVAGTSYSDNSVSNGTQYFYVVSAQNAAGSGPDSTSLRGAPTRT
ncbi:MAG: galactose oxidase-like domain-containing protein [Planctomycetota bacterium]